MKTETLNTEKWESNNYIGNVKEFIHTDDKWFFAQLIDNNAMGEKEVKPALVLGSTKKQVQERTELIVTAVNACKEINPNNPLQVAKLIPEMFAILEKLYNDTDVNEAMKDTDLRDLEQVLKVIES